MRASLVCVLAVLCAACVAAPQVTGPESDSERLAREGYRLQSYRGKALYCRSEMVTGSAFSGRHCLTREEIAQRARQVRDAIDLRDMRGADPCGSLCK